jgi:hypothetical protein
VAERLETMSDAELEGALVDLGMRLAHPPTPDLAASVRRRLAQQPAPRGPFWVAFGPLQRRLALALVALLVLAGAVLALSPEVRTAVADRLGLRGVRISQIREVPSPLPTATSSRLNLGQRITLEQVRAQVTYQILVPAALGAADEVYLLGVPAGGQVGLVYYPRPDLPEAQGSGMSVLLTQFQGDIHSNGPIGKGLPPGTRMEDVQVNGDHGYWVDGDPHVFFFLDSQGRVQGETTRLAGNVLLWEHGALTLRLESALQRDTVLAIARSVQ